MPVVYMGLLPLMVWKHNSIQVMPPTQKDAILPAAAWRCPLDFSIQITRTRAVAARLKHKFIQNKIVQNFRV